MSALAFNLAAASILVILVLAVRRPVAAVFGARAAYALWLAPLLRLVMPPLPAAAAPIATGETGTALWTQVMPSTAAAAGPALDWLLLLWIAGAFAMLGWHLLVHFSFVRRALADGTPLLVDGMTMDVVATPAVEGPMATGLIHRLVLVPVDFDARFTPDQRRYALLHEQLHHRRGDIWASAAALLAASALWFNPFAHVALGAFRRDMEAACDASLVAATGRDHVPAYAETILASASRPVPRSLCALTSIDELKGRLMMLKLDHGAGRRLTGLLVAGGIAATGLAVAAPVRADTPKETRTEVRKTVVTTDGQGPTGEPGEAKLECPGKLEVFEVEAASTAGKKERSKIAVCSKDAAPANVVAGLETMLTRLDGNSEMDPAVKSQLKAKVQARIAELRAGR